jgi:hypothetical protein
VHFSAGMGIAVAAMPVDSSAQLYAESPFVMLPPLVVPPRSPIQDVPPVLAVSRFYLCSVLRSGMFWLAVLKSEVRSVNTLRGRS